MLDDPLGENGYRIKNQPNCAISRDVAKALPDILNTIRCRMNSAKIELMNASIQRIVSKACGLQDVSYIFAKLRQRFFAQSLHLSPEADARAQCEGQKWYRNSA